jgi:hypothetical protein
VSTTRRDVAEEEVKVEKENGRRVPSDPNRPKMSVV